MNKRKHLSIDDVINLAWSYAFDGWSFYVAMNKAGVKGENKAIILCNKTPELKAIKEFCDSRKVKDGFMTAYNRRLESEKDK
jgi:hypothetical protein